MSPARHGHTLRAPWYVLERGALEWEDPVAQRPVLQKYDRADFVKQVIEDPRRSLRFDDTDVWTFPVPVPVKVRDLGRSRFATHRLVRTGLRKLYQPNHERHYAVVVELFCDTPGLPLPGRPAGVDVWFVLRRERIAIAEGEVATKALRKLAPELVAQLDREQHKRPPDVAVDDTADADDVLWIESDQKRVFTAEQQAAIDVIKPRTIVEAWVGDGERGRWVAVPDPPKPTAPERPDLPELVDGEQEWRMWPVPADACERAAKRSLWFAPVPTLSGLHDTETGLPQLDDRTTYRILCFARTPPDPGHATCPTILGWSERSEPFRLAAFLDPAGTANHRVTIVMPDFRALAARLAEPRGPGGVEIVSPPGSQLNFGVQDGKPVNPKPDQLGTDTMRCTVALELLMIVAMFLFSLFLPIVVLLFQLWWMLLLRFCLPLPTDKALQALEAHFTAGGSIADLPAPANPRDLDKADKLTLDELLDIPGFGAELDAAPAFPAKSGAAAADLVAGAAQPQPGAPTLPLADPVHDPLCPPGPAGP